MPGWFSFGGGAKDDEGHFIPFEEKTIDEQAYDITMSLASGEENPLFTFDRQDHEVKREFHKSIMSCGITVGLVTMVDLRVLNTTKYGRALGPLRKFIALNALNIPIYYYFNHEINSKYMDMKKHLVKRYLIQGDELLYKRRPS